MPTKEEPLGRRLRLANKEIRRTVWLLEHRSALDDAAQSPWSAVQPVLVSPGVDDLLGWMEAERTVAGHDSADARLRLDGIPRGQNRLRCYPRLTGILNNPRNH